MKKIKVLHNQTMFDIAIQHFGTVNAAYDIALLNDLCVSDVLPVSMELKIPDEDYGFSESVNYYLSNKITPASADKDVYLINEFIFNQPLPIIV